MTFKEIAMKNFLSHTRRYFTYLLCSSFTIMVFFIYMTLFFNDDLMNYAKDTGFDVLFNISIIAVFLFSVFFIHYAHTTFVGTRTGEFALLMTLGLVRKNIGRMIIIENVIILSLSMTLGLGFGALFSRLFFLIIRFMVDQAELEYVLNYKSFGFTVMMFLLIYGLAIGLSRKMITKLSIVELIRKKREMKRTKGNLWVGLAGTALFIGSLVFVLIITQMEDFPDHGYLFLVYAIISFTAMYMIITQFGNLLIHGIKRNKKLYYKSILSISEIEVTFHQNKKILFVLSLLSAMIIFFVASPFSLLSISKDIAQEGRDGDIEYAVVDTFNQMDEDAFQSLMADSKTPFQGVRYTEFLLCSFEMNGMIVQKPVISETLFHQMNEEAKNVTLEDGEIMELVTTWLPGYNELKEENEITILVGDERIQYNKSISFTGSGLSEDLLPSKINLVIRDDEYVALKKKLDSSKIGAIRHLDFEKWELTEEVELGLVEGFTKTSVEYPIASKLKSYEGLSKVYAMMIFFTSFMGILFFVSAGSILYFKQYGDMERLKEIYRKLFQIGLTKKELTRIYIATLRINFFTPLFFGIIIGFAFIDMTTYLVGGGEMIGTFLRSSAVVAGIYLIFQLAYYSLALKKYKQTVFKEGFM